MKRPPMRLDGRAGALRWVDAHGRPQGKSGRLSFLSSVWAAGVLAGTGTSYEIRLAQGAGAHPWHRIEATPEEMRAVCLEHPERIKRMVGRGMVARCERIRARRIERGLPVV